MPNQTGFIIPVTRHDLARVFPQNPKMVMAMEALFQQTAIAVQSITTGADATKALNDATVITLSANEAFNNERVLAFDPQSITLTDHGPGATLDIAGRVSVTGVFRCTLTLAADTDVTLPSSGTIPSSADATYANDAAAAAGGVPLGGFYKQPAGVVVWRQV